MKTHVFYAYQRCNTREKRSADHVSETDLGDGQIHTKNFPFYEMKVFELIFCQFAIIVYCVLIEIICATYI